MLEKHKTACIITCTYVLPLTVSLTAHDYRQIAVAIAIINS